MKYFTVDNLALSSLIDASFRKIDDQLKRNDLERYSLLLIGSFSRGEASWHKIENRIILLSDIEFYFIYENSVNTKIIYDIIKSCLLDNLNDYTSAFFHIDVSFIPLQKVSKLQKRLINYEAKKFGYVVSGLDYKGRFPDIDVKSINKLDIQNIIFHRAFSHYYYCSSRHDVSEIEKLYSLSKNALDLINIVLIDQKVLLPGVAQRLKYFLANHNYFNDFYYTCSKIKFDDDFSIISYNQALSNYVLLLEDIYFRYIKKRTLFSLRSYLGVIKRICVTKKLPLSRKKTLFLLTNAIKSDCKSEYHNQLLISQYISFGFKDNS